MAWADCWLELDHVRVGGRGALMSGPATGAVGALPVGKGGGSGAGVRIPRPPHSNRARHRLSRVGNRELNAALHRVAMTKPAVTHPPRP